MKVYIYYNGLIKYHRYRHFRMSETTDEMFCHYCDTIHGLICEKINRDRNCKTMYLNASSILEGICIPLDSPSKRHREVGVCPQKNGGTCTCPPYYVMARPDAGKASLKVCRELLLAFQDGKPTYPNNKGSFYDDRFYSIEHFAGEPSLLSLILNFNKQVWINQQLERGTPTFFPYTVGDKTFQVPVPLTVELYLKLAKHITSKM